MIAQEQQFKRHMIRHTVSGEEELEEGEENCSYTHLDKRMSL